jgi:hypothetical protein
VCGCCGAAGAGGCADASAGKAYGGARLGVSSPSSARLGS